MSDQFRSPRQSLSVAGKVFGSCIAACTTTPPQRALFAVAPIRPAVPDPVGSSGQTAVTAYLRSITSAPRGFRYDITPSGQGGPPGSDTFGRPVVMHSTGGTSGLKLVSRSCFEG